MASSDRDAATMRRALDLAARGLGGVEPNPLVGAVVVAGDRVVGEGYHQRFGGPHAEVFALRQAGDLARGADLFVSLEPCCHTGKTPPCTEAIIAAGIRRVVAAVQDPFPEVAGRGAEGLRRAGIEVVVGVCEEEARRLNAAFFKRQKTGLPLVIAKWAMTLDGRLATAAGESRWISSEASRRRVHEVRRIVDAVLVGAGTVVADSPLLTVRHVAPLPERGQPVRVVLDDRLIIDPSKPPAAGAREAPVLVFTTAAAMAAQTARAEALRAAGCEVAAVPAAAGGLDVTAVVQELGRRGMSRVLVEGGARVFGAFFAARLVDRIMIFIAPRVLGEAGALGPVAGPATGGLAAAAEIHDLAVERIGPDLLVQGRLGDF